MIGAWALIRGNTVLGCFPSTITQHRFSNQETVIKKKTHGPSRLDTAGNFPVRAEISESFKNVAYSKYQPVPQFYFFDRLYGMFCQFVIGLIHRSCAVDQITAFSSFQYKYTIYFLHCMFFLLLVSWNTFQSWFLKQFSITSQFKCRPINPVILFYLMDCSMKLHVSSFTNRADLKQPVTSVDKTKGVPSSRFEKTQTINSWRRHTLCDSVYGEQE